MLELIMMNMIKKIFEILFFGKLGKKKMEIIFGKKNLKLIEKKNL
jgi:hypothetical protein